MTKIVSPNDVRDYWLGDLEPKDWYVANDQVDAEIVGRFQPTWEIARDGGCQDWLESPDDLLSFLILCDQFPRNMFRGHSDSFATDPISRAVTAKAIKMGWDLKIAEPERQFIYMPLMHSEVLEDHDQAIVLFQDRMPKTGSMNADHCLAHRNVIAEFGRFPYRNDAIGRQTTPAEQVFLDAGGYGYALRQVQGSAV